MKKFLLTFLILFLGFYSAPFLTKAEMESSNYKITSDVIGSFGTKDSSTSFELGDTGGEVGTGDSSSASFNLGAGFWQAVGDDAILIFNVTSNLADLGVLSNSTVRYGTAAFNVATTAQGGYVVEFTGNPLSFESNTINPLSSPGTSNPGTEQFGFNMVANSSPAIGLDPYGGYGQVSSDYNTANSFKFASGDRIAECSRPSSQTNFTMSFIANIQNSSESGQYSSDLNIVATGRY